MKSSKLILLSISLIFLISNNSAWSNYLYFSDPKGFKGNGQGSIDSATIVTKPKGMFLEVSVYLNLSAKNYNYSKYDSFEIVFNFDLPEKAALTESWLWLDNSRIVRGEILDVWTASSIYENIVKRRRDPSILKKLSATNYELRIYPLSGSSYRKIKLVYLIPMECNGSNVSKLLSFPFLKTSYVPLEDARIIAFPQLKYGEPTLTSSSSQAIIKKQEPGFGTIYYSTVQLSDLVSGVSINYPLEKIQTSFYNLFEYNNEKYYQLGVKLNSYIDHSIDKKLLIVLDYNKNNAYPLDIILDKLKNSLNAQYDSTAKINFLYYDKFTLKFSSPDWQNATKSNINGIIENIKMNIGPLNNTQSILLSAIDYIKSKGGDGKVLFISSDNTYTNVETANNFIKVLNTEGLANIPIVFDDISYFRDRCTYTNNKTYCNSEYLFENLARISKGSYFRWILNDLNSLFNSSINSCFGNIYNFDFYTRLQNGFCYNRYNLNSTEAIFINDYFIQVGKCNGAPPFQVELSGFLNNKTFSAQFEIPIENQIFADSTNTQIWAGFNLRELEKENSNNAINSIISTSTEFHVLSQYTAFLCLEDTSYLCPQCKDETTIHVAVVDTKKDSMQIQAFPNPFSDFVEITMEGIKDAKQLSIQIYDLRGVKVDELLKFGIEEDKIKAHWTPKEDLKSGIYICNICSVNGNKSIKLVKK